MEHLRPITEQQKRTNILLAELDRPTIPHMQKTPNTKLDDVRIRSPLFVSFITQNEMDGHIDTLE